MAEHPILWFLANIRKPLFAHGAVIELAGGEDRLPYATLQNWANRELVRPAPECGGWRKYDTATLAQVCLCLPLLKDFNVPVQSALPMIHSALLRTVRDLVIPKNLKRKLTDSDIPIERVQQYLAIFMRDPPGSDGDAAGLVLPMIVHRDKIAARVLRGGPSIVMPFGRALLDLAKRAQLMIEPPIVLPEKPKIEDPAAYGLAALGAD